MEEPERKRIAAKQLPLLSEQRVVLFRSRIVRRIFNVGGVQVRITHMRHIFFTDNATAYRTTRHLGDFVNNISSELILVHMTHHKPFSVDTDEVEPVEAIVDPSKIRPGCECLILFPWLCKAFQTHQASAFNGVVVIRKYFPECLEYVEHQPTLIILYFFIE